jgi:hypothetical protein
MLEPRGARLTPAMAYRRSRLCRLNGIAALIWKAEVATGV